MSTNSRPFFSNFLAAFRAHSGVQKVSTSPPGAVSGASLSTAHRHQQAASASAAAAAAAQQNSSSLPSGSRSISTKAAAAAASNSPPPSSTSPAAGATTVAIQTATHQFQPTRQHSTSPYSRSPGSPGPAGGFAAAAAAGYSRGRRGSDSSSEGFRDALGAEKWYIGGRTAAGEEKFYKLSMMKRPTSLDRLSMDRMSL